MIKANMKGKIIAVSPVSEIGDKKTKKQFIIVQVAGYTDQFGDKKGKDEHWKIDIIGDKVDKLKASKDWQDRKADITVYLSSLEVVKKNDAEADLMYIVNVNLAEITLL